MEDDVYARAIFAGTGAYTPSTTEKHRRTELAKAFNYDPSRRICAPGAETLWISMLHHAHFNGICIFNSVETKQCTMIGQDTLGGTTGTATFATMLQADIVYFASTPIPTLLEEVDTDQRAIIRTREWAVFQVNHAVDNQILDVLCAGVQLQPGGWECGRFPAIKGLAWQHGCGLSLDITQILEYGSAWLWTLGCLLYIVRQRRARPNWAVDIEDELRQAQKDLNRPPRKVVDLTTGNF